MISHIDTFNCMFSIQIVINLVKYLKQRVVVIFELLSYLTQSKRARLTILMHSISDEFSKIFPTERAVVTFTIVDILSTEQEGMIYYIDIFTCIFPTQIVMDSLRYFLKKAVVIFATVIIFSQSMKA